MKYTFAYDELLRQGFVPASNQGVNNKFTSMVQERETYSVCIDIFTKCLEEDEREVVNAYKFITDKTSGAQFARHSVFNEKANSIHAELSEEELTALAYFITAEAFCNVLDKGGRPYFEHCLSVARKLGPTVRESYKQIAVMHDLLEDIEHYTTMVLDDLGFSNFVYMGVYYLSKLSSRDEIHTNGKFDISKYMHIIMQHRECLVSKMSDLQHNSDLRRLKGVEEKDFSRTRQYAIWYDRLKSHGISMGWI